MKITTRYQIFIRVLLAALVIPGAGGCVRHLDDCHCEVDNRTVRLDMTFDPASFIYPFMQDFNTPGDPSRYELRFILDFYPADNGNPAESDRLRRIVRYVGDVDGDKVQLSVAVPDGKVRMLAWADFVVAGQRTDLYYDTGNLRRVTVKEPSQWGDPHKAGFEGTVVIDPASLTDEYNIVEVPVEMPMACYRIISTDVQQYRALSGVPDIETLRTDVGYQLWFPWSYDTFTGQVVQVETGVSYTAPVSGLTQSEAVLAADFVFVARQALRAPYDANAIVNFQTYGESATVAFWADIEIGLNRGQISEWRAPWLTTASGTGIVINPTFDGELIFDF